MDRPAGHERGDPADGGDGIPPEVSSRPARLAGLVVVANDVDALCDLLVDLLGGDDAGVGAQGSRCVWFRPGVTVEVVPASAIEHADEVWADAGEGLHRLRFAVDDPESTASRLGELGYRRAGVTGPVVVHAPAGMGGALELVPRGGVPAADRRGLHGGTGDGLLLRIDHVCAPSPDLRRSFAVFGEILGGAPVFGGDAPQLGVLTLQVRFEGGMKVETLQPVQPDTAVGNFAERHPARFHHLTMLTDDVPAAAERLASQGWETIDTDVVSDPDWHETYLRPSRTARVLIQLGATRVSYTDALDGPTMEAVFEGAIDATQYVMVPK